RAAIGARIRVEVETPGGLRSIHKSVGSGGSFGASPLRQEIGLGDARRIARVEIRWPAPGGTQVVTNVQPGAFWRIREGMPAADPWLLSTFRLPPPK
ncbi:MAG: ASPIC/UnbV domain-containing protein, partial [Verrucomicrobiota bacterium]